MDTGDFALIATPTDLHVEPCRKCGNAFDLVSAPWCNCIARERTFHCPHCGGCACEASYYERTEFWMRAPAALWKRRRKEDSGSLARLQSLDQETLPRPLALIVDDEPMVVTVAEHVLRELGFTTLVTTKAEEAYAIAISAIPDLLLTDALMPRLDGRELCLRLKSSDLTKGMKIIVMSSVYRHVTHRNEAFKQFHVDEYLEKPIRPAVIRAAIERLLPHLAHRQHPHRELVAS